MLMLRGCLGQRRPQASASPLVPSSSTPAYGEDLVSNACSATASHWMGCTEEHIDAFLRRGSLRISVKRVGAATEIMRQASNVCIFKSSINAPLGRRLLVSEMGREKRAERGRRLPGACLAPSATMCRSSVTLYACVSVIRHVPPIRSSFVGAATKLSHLMRHASNASTSNGDLEGQMADRATSSTPLVSAPSSDR